MSGPANSSTDRWGAREYRWGDDAFPSVTTLLKDGIPKNALQYWVGKECGEFVTNNYDLIGQTLKAPNGRKLAYDMVRNAPWANRDNAADFGTSLHEYAEHRAAGRSRAEALLALDLAAEHQARFVGFQEHFELFLDEWKPDFERSEFTVYNRRYGYAGTGDLLAQIRGHGRTLGDYKTSKPGKQGHGIYPETCLQLNAYANGEFIGMPNGTEEPMPEVETLLAINIRHNGYHVIPAEKSDRAFRAFLYASQVARFVGNGHTFLGEPLAPPLQAVAS